MAQEPVHVPSSGPTVYAFDVLHLLGGFGFSVIIATAFFSPRVIRSAPWFSFSFSWVVSTLSYTLLLFAGKHTAAFDKTTPFSLCSIQAALIYAAPILTGFTSFAFVISIFDSLRSVVSYTVARERGINRLAVIGLPYLAWLTAFLAFLIFGIINPKLVAAGEHGTYCHLSVGFASKISSGIVIVLTVISVGLETIIVWKLYKNKPLMQSSKISLSMTVRIMVFSVFGIMALSIGIAFIATSAHGPYFDLSLAILPFVGAIIFGTQMDIVKAWTTCDSRKGMESSAAFQSNQTASANSRTGLQ